MKAGKIALDDARFENVSWELLAMAIAVKLHFSQVAN